MLATNRDLPAVTADGQPIELLANINNVDDARKAVAMGAAGVGLFRTEYLFLTHPNVPDEDEQLDAYQAIIDASPACRVTIRTLDLGGDKTIPYLGHDREANPFLGWRSIRLSFEHPQFFTTQIRAIVRSARHARKGPADVRIMFPMITTLEEIRRVRAMVHRVRRALEAEGQEVGEMPIRPDAGGSRGCGLDRIAVGSGRFRFDRLERSGCNISWLPIATIRRSAIFASR